MSIFRGMDARRTWLNLLFMMVAILFNRGELLAQVPPGDYKIGVVLFRPASPTANMDALLDDIVAQVARGQPYRTKDSISVRLLINLEVNWRETEIYPNNYAFAWYQKFARACEARNIAWTPLLSPHYLPAYIQDTYSQDQIRNAQQGVVTNPFMPLSPSSAVWTSEMALWVDAFIEAMTMDIDTVVGDTVNHFAAGGAIREIMIGNELTYPGNALASYDQATQLAWQQTQSSSMPSTLTSGFADFRFRELEHCILDLVLVVRKAFRQRGLPEPLVSTKILPLYFPRADLGGRDSLLGYSNANLQVLIDSTDYTSISCIICPDSNGNGPGLWTQANNFSTTASRSTKDLYLATYNSAPHCGRQVSRREIVEDLKLGIDSFRLRNMTFFAWNPQDVNYQITTEQIAALREVMDCIVASESVGRREESNFTRATLVVYPIPSSGKLLVTLKEGAELPVKNIHIEILDQSGCIWPAHWQRSGSEQLEIFLDGLPPQVYLLKVSVGNTVKYRRFSIQKH